MSDHTAHEQRGESPSLREEIDALLRLAGAARGGDAPRILVVAQPVGSGLHALQLALAVEAARQGLRTLVVDSRAPRYDLEGLGEQIINRAGGITIEPLPMRLHAFGRGLDTDLNAGATVGLLAEGDGDAPEHEASQITLADGAMLDRLLDADSPPDIDHFDLVIVGEGYGSEHAGTAARIGARLRRPRLILLWTTATTADVAAVVTSGRISVFDPAATAGADDAHARPDPGARYPLTTWPDYTREQSRAHLRRLLVGISPEAEGHFSQFLGRELRAPRDPLAAPAYSQLPPLSELKTARVSAVTPATGRYAEFLDLAQREHAAAPGMYMLVPQTFPDECEIVETFVGYYARHEEGGVEHRFLVWPEPLVRTARETYSRMLAEWNLPSTLIGGTCTPARDLPDDARFVDVTPPTSNGRSGDGKPEGRFQCVACNTVWEGSQLIRSPYHQDAVWTCGDAFCGAMVSPC